MDNGSQTALILERLQHGGFVVKQGDWRPGDYIQTLFAATTIDEALGFMRDKIKPVALTASKSDP